MSIGTFLILGILLPYLVGRTWAKILPWREGKVGITTSIGMGLLALGAFGYVILFLLLKRGMAVDAASKLLWPLGGAIAVVCLVILNTSLRKSFHVERVSWKVWVPAILALILSVGFLRPDGGDNTGEVVRRMADTNAFYAAQPYSGLGIQGVNHSPLEALYMMLAWNMKLDAVVVLHRVVSVILLIAFFGLYLEMGNLFFHEQKEQRDTYLVIVIGLSFLSAFLGGHYLWNVLANPWNGQTVLGLMVLPVAFILAYRWFVTRRWQILPAAACLLLDAQLAYADGAFMVLFLWGVTIACAVVKTYIERRRAA